MKSRLLRPLDDIGALILGFEFILMGIAWLVSTVIVQRSRCPKCGLYDYLKAIGPDEPPAFSFKTSFIMVTESVTRAANGTTSYHRHYERRHTSSGDGLTQWICRYCKHDFSL